MADEHGSSDSRCDDNTVNNGGEITPEVLTTTQVQGWLRIRSKRTHKWKKKWFIIRNKDLVYGDGEQNTRKHIPLEAADISESQVDKKPHAFRVKPKDSKRTYYIMADDESSRIKWMQAICYVKANCTGSGEQSQACVVQ